MADEGWAVGLVRTGRAWELTLSLGEQKLIGEHMAYLGRLMEAGEVTQAGALFAPDHGPAEDGLVALIVYAVDAARARVIADKDPAVRAGLITLDIRPWYTGS
jgi:uncharacterized protein YciI